MFLFHSILFLILTYECNSARIFSIFYVQSYSHNHLALTLLTELAERGHEVTLLTPFVPKDVVKNLKVIHMKFPPKSVDTQVNPFDVKKMTLFERIMFIEQYGLNEMEVVFNVTEVQTFLLENHHFDAVIFPQFVSEALRGFCYHFRAVCIGLSPVILNSMSGRPMGNPFHPSYIPNLFSPFSDRMNFFERFHNTIIVTAEMLFHHFYVLPRHNQLLQKHFPGAPHINDLYYNTSLMLVNTHVATNFPVPLVPNIIPIGGYHIRPLSKLSKALQDYLDDARDGAIYFSMGSYLNSADIPNDKLNAILNVFRKLKQKVLWKFNGNKLTNLPPNVKLGTWFPQQDILDHPNVKLFITHGGLLSTMEAIYHGVPVVAIPFFGDQEMNAANAENCGYAVVVSYEELTENTLQTAVDEVLINPKYGNIARRRSRIFHDEPMRPLDKAVFWIEYVIRHNGAPHLRTTALGLTWYQYLLLDMVLFIITVLFLFLFILKKLLAKLFRKNTTSKKTKLKTR
ncbi:hypothetical protein RI129_006327 [Pyrocoelia pectoralis]|uniref:UDP-glucuronosyltransferase n=1 Tax=Pyrocoelia pectoralis TaxID=417401 RepID=A0AAN7VC94_9COLE